jgi:hypothetical protein
MFDQVVCETQRHLVRGQERLEGFLRRLLAVVGRTARSDGDARNVNSATCRSSSARTNESPASWMAGASSGRYIDGAPLTRHGGGQRGHSGQPCVELFMCHYKDVQWHQVGADGGELST